MSGLKVLVADDAAFIRDLVKRTIRDKLGFLEVVDVENGKKAQRQLMKDNFALVLCDWEMPEQSGIEVLKWLREYEASEDVKKTPFIMVTSRGSKENVVEAVSSGVNDYIGKPFTPEQLVNKVLKQLQKHHGAALKALKGNVAPKPANNPFGESASLLTGGKAPPPKAANKPSATVDALMGGATKAAPKKQKSSQIIKGRLRIAEHVLEARVLDVSMTEVVADVDNFGEVALFSQAVIDIPSAKGDNHISLNAVVSGLQASERSLNAESIRVRVFFVDDDASKLEALTHVVANRRRA
ncbi:response regulator [Salinibius halmophilus]|uniref:response regulator n=1 Tax=Salinibius halmophilus TaxID=1853216 RepID=UPI000E665F67|nr:response regulator [Salinibius halmophilus]